MPLSKQGLLRKLPSVDAFLEDAELQKLAEGVPRRIVVDSVRTAVKEARKRLLAATDDVDVETIRRSVLACTAADIRQATGPHYRHVINAAGIILHTGIGRAVLPTAALEQIRRQLTGYSLVQAELESGGRGKRDGRIERLLRQLTGAEAATVVNNNAAATMITLNSVAGGPCCDRNEVIVSRGQLVEIGGSFRLPDVMAASGAKLVEVGTTNKTHLRDYAAAITENTAAIMRVHPSNYKISGFTSEVPLHEMVELAHRHALPLVDDVGAGALTQFARFGFEPEPTLLDAVRAGADLIMCSADKLIGGAQGGIILGRADLIGAIRKNPLARIVRVGKLTLTALEATLMLLLDESTALAEVPTLRMLGRSLPEITDQARRIAERLAQRTSAAKVTDVEGSSQMGSGSLPTQDIPTRLVAVQPHRIPSGQLALRLRCGTPPVFTRVQKGQVLIDPRTLLSGEEDVLIDAIITVLEAEG